MRRCSAVSPETEGVEAMFSTLIPCLFAAYLFGGTAIGQLDYRPVQILPTECQFKVYIADNKNLTLILLKPTLAATDDAQIRVEVPMPANGGWKRFQYWWGSDRAYIEGREVLIKHGPVSIY
ncbi:MAG: hypothetical protein ACPGYT_03080 [Nitrospirales bacterium]